MNLVANFTGQVSDWPQGRKPRDYNAGDGRRVVLWGFYCALIFPARCAVAACGISLTQVDNLSITSLPVSDAACLDGSRILYVTLM